MNSGKIEFENESEKFFPNSNPVLVKMRKPVGFERLSITKKTIDVYKLRSLQGVSGWADITVDDCGKRGRISIASDFGQWQHYWEGCGMPFRQFLRSFDMEYAADKFGEDRWFDSRATVAQMKVRVLETRRSEYTTRETAREVFDEIETIVHSGSRESFLRQCEDLPAVMRFFEYVPPCETNVSPRFRRFWREIWEPFVEHLEREDTAAGEGEN